MAFRRTGINAGHNILHQYIIVQIIIKVIQETHEYNIDYHSQYKYHPIFPLQNMRFFRLRFRTGRHKTFSPFLKIHQRHTSLLIKRLHLRCDIFYFIRSQFIEHRQT